MITREFICDSCDEVFELSWDDEHLVRYCPFCGDLLDDEEDEDDEDDEDEWDDEY